MKNKNIIKIIFKSIGLIILSIILFFSYGYLIGRKGLIVKEYKVIDNIGDEFYGLKIVHFSDIHYSYYFGTKELQNVVNKINELKPDIIVFTGDLIDIEPTSEEKEEIINILKELRANIGKYAINGNLDTSSFNEIIDRSGFTNLNDNYDTIYSKNSKIIISGLSSSLNNNTTLERFEKINEYLNENSDAYKILLIHEPDYIDKLNSNFNLILAGHSHNGQVNLPIIGAIKKPNGSRKYYKNYYETNKGKLYISSGIGTSVMPIRLFNKPSINFYRIVK